MLECVFASGACCVPRDAPRSCKDTVPHPHPRRLRLTGPPDPKLQYPSILRLLISANPMTPPPPPSVRSMPLPAPPPQPSPNSSCPCSCSIRFRPAGDTLQRRRGRPHWPPHRQRPAGLRGPGLPRHRTAPVRRHAQGACVYVCAHVCGGSWLCWKGGCGCSRSGTGGMVPRTPAPARPRAEECRNVGPMRTPRA